MLEVVGGGHLRFCISKKLAGGADSTGLGSTEHCAVPHIPHLSGEPVVVPTLPCGADQDVLVIK